VEVNPHAGKRNDYSDWFQGDHLNLPIKKLGKGWSRERGKLISDSGEKWMGPLEVM